VPLLPPPPKTHMLVNDHTAPTQKLTHPCCCVQAAVRGLMSREHQMLTWHTIAGDLEAKQKALAEADKSKVGCSFLLQEPPGARQGSTERDVQQKSCP